MNSYDIGDSAILRGRFGTNPTVLLSETAANATTLTVAAVTGLAPGDQVVVNPGADTEEWNTINVITGRVLGLSSGWIHPHHIRERLWELTDPSTVSLKIKGPSSSTDSYTFALGQITQDGQGRFSKSISLASAGTYYYRWAGTGTAETVGEGQFSVRPSQFAS